MIPVSEKVFTVPYSFFLKPSLQIGLWQIQFSLFIVQRDLTFELLAKSWTLIPPILIFNVNDRKVLNWSLVV